MISTLEKDFSSNKSSSRVTRNSQRYARIRLQRFAERLFSYAMLAAATALSVDFSYEAQILRCPRLHPSL
jgi:hypothetical protein